MRPLSATEAIGPAFQRTRDLLARPFRWQTFLKIAAVAFFAEVGGGSFNFNFPGRSAGAHPQIPSAVLAFLVAFAVVIGLVALVIGLILFYVGSRLQLVLVEMVATRQSWVSPLWRKYGAATWRWIGLKLLYFLIVILAMLLLAAPFIVYFVRAHGHDWLPRGLAGHLVAIVFIVLAAIVVLTALTAVYTLLRDFVVPFIAFEDLGISDSLGRLRRMLAMEAGPFAAFVVLRLLLVIAFAIAGEVCVFLVALLSLVPFGIVGGILWLALHHAGTAGTVILIACGTVGGLIFLCWMVCVAVAVLGSVYVFAQAYALYFLGGRYPLLGDLLDRSTPPPANAYSQAYPPQFQPLLGPRSRERTPTLAGRFSWYAKDSSYAGQLSLALVASLLNV